ncbi:MULTISPECIES: aldo/keto reductase [Metallosphaera]|uniref:Aldo/keto reductase n=3 Tax=Metallosphaera TaxID=41980 RepID=A4YIW3_METS5|nr:MULTISPECIES: aldo/keto reductase [Metallosphaera]ABP96365.1 aldo/keto reductase [Metallosphaera sedula DSM 5348]AIM28348.1 aldo/keto reductase [Metallosphaera sedula]AKV75144.1 aldo/keto reductase [Metallosphaera sedula]AKV77382.1 aldo/keto reductase [Metallosphaera sedula]AKV79633.1 aldo/keto reductase [Metallosphaera sedula]
MLLRDLGHTGIKTSELGIGMWTLVTDWWGEPDKAQEIVRRAIELGINFFDTADMYGNGRAEEVLGRSLGSKRDKVVILTKVGYDFYSSPQRPRQRFDLDYLRTAVDRSLKRLSTNYVDILMIHNPKMKDITRRDLLDFMRSLKSDGIARAVGVALGPTLGWEDEGLKAIEMGYEALEHIFNLIELYPGLRFLEFDVGHIVRVPHASDVLNESKWPLNYDPKLHRHFKSQQWINTAVDRTKGLLDYASKLGVTLSQLALSFVLSHKRVSTVIPNITTVRELEEFVKSTEFVLNNDDVNFLMDYYERNYRDLNEESIKETQAYK